jgi:hypothetical protein
LMFCLMWNLNFSGMERELGEESPRGDVEKFIAIYFNL